MLACEHVLHQNNYPPRVVPGSELSNRKHAATCAVPEKPEGFKTSKIRRWGGLMFLDYSGSFYYKHRNEKKNGLR